MPKGLVEQTENNTVYLLVKHHSLVQESKTERPGFKPVEVSNPKTKETIVKFIKYYRCVEGYICKIEFYDTEEQYDTRFMGWKIHMDADGVPVVLDLPLNSRASNRFMKVAENLDFSEPVEFRAWHDRESDGVAFYIGQGGQAVPQKYTKDNPGNCPPPVQSRVTKEWNFDVQKEFLCQRMLDAVIPEVEQMGNQMPSGEAVRAATVGGHSVVVADDETDDDEIPF